MMILLCFGVIFLSRTKCTISHLHPEGEVEHMSAHATWCPSSPPLPSPLKGYRWSKVRCRSSLWSSHSAPARPPWPYRSATCSASCRPWHRLSKIEITHPSVCLYFHTMCCHTMLSYHVVIICVHTMLPYYVDPMPAELIYCDGRVSQNVATYAALIGFHTRWYGLWMVSECQCSQLRHWHTQGVFSALPAWSHTAKCPVACLSYQDQIASACARCIHPPEIRMESMLVPLRPSTRRQQTELSTRGFVSLEGMLKDSRVVGKR